MSPLEITWDALKVITIFMKKNLFKKLESMLLFCEN